MLFTWYLILGTENQHFSYSWPVVKHYVQKFGQLCTKPCTVKMSLDREFVQKRQSELTKVFRSRLVLSRHMTIVPVRHQSVSCVTDSDHSLHSQRSLSVGSAEQRLYYEGNRAAFQVNLIMIMLVHLSNTYKHLLLGWIGKLSSFGSSVSFCLWPRLVLASKLVFLL